MLFTTLREILAHIPCSEGFNTLKTSLGTNWGEDQPITLLQILESNGIEHAIRALRPQNKKYAVKFAVGCAERVLYIFETKYPEDKRPRQAIAAAKNWLASPTVTHASASNHAAYVAYTASGDSLAAAHASASASLDAAFAVSGTALAAAHASASASMAAAHASASASMAAAHAAFAVASTAHSALDAGYAAEFAAAAVYDIRDKEREWQADFFKKIVTS